VSHPLEVSHGGGHQLDAGMKTKELCERTGVSEATLRRWLRDGRPVPELSAAKRDWRGWREFDESHVEAIRRYQEQKTQGDTEAGRQLRLFNGQRGGRRS